MNDTKRDVRPEGEDHRPETLDADTRETAAAAGVDPEAGIDVPDDDMQGDEPRTSDVVAALEARISQLEAEKTEIRDQALRALAEAENTRKRAQRDRDDAKKYGATGLARDLLSVADNLRRAIDSVPAERRGDDSVKSLIEGVEMVERELLSAFEKHSVKRMDPTGKPFDPNHHQAMFEVPTDEQAPGTVVQTVQIGYLLHDRLLRPAMVGVAKDGGGNARVDETV